MHKTNVSNCPVPSLKTLFTKSLPTATITNTIKAMKLKNLLFKSLDTKFHKKVEFKTWITAQKPLLMETNKYFVEVTWAERVNLKSPYNLIKEITTKEEEAEVEVVIEEYNNKVIEEAEEMEEGDSNKYIGEAEELDITESLDPRQFQMKTWLWNAATRLTMELHCKSWSKQ